MEVGERDGKVVWIKKNGEVSKMNVSLNKKLDYYNFPVRGCSVDIIRGEVGKDNLLLVKLFGNNNKYYGTYIMSNLTRERVEIKPYEDFLLEIFDLPDSEINSIDSLSDFIEKKREEKRNEVEIDKLVEIKGLKVWDSNYFDGYWCEEEGEFYDFPEDWEILFKGDGALTRKVQEKGPYWVLNKIKSKYSERIGICAPVENIEKAFEELGGEKAAKEREKSKKEGQKKREENISNKIRNSIKEQFPNIPERDVDEIMKRSRRTGAVGTAQWVYFGDGSPTAAVYAVKAHIRHTYTVYEDLLENGVERKEARRKVRTDIKKKLEEWS